MRLSGVTWVRPLTVDDIARDVHVVLKPTADAAAFEVLADGVLHAQGNVAFERRLEPATHDLAAVKERCGHRMTSSEFYRAAEEQGFRYGRALQSVQMLCWNGTEALARLELPDVIRETAPPYVLHPSILDGALQTVMSLRRGAVAGAPCVPLALDAIEILDEVAATCFAYATRNEAGYDIHLLDESGAAVVMLQGVSLRAAAVPVPRGLLDVLRQLEGGELDLDGARRLIDVAHG